jgi:beta-N-acetylhexosaminidase
LELDEPVSPAERKPWQGDSPPLPTDLHDRLGQMMMVGFRGLTEREAEPTLRRIGEGSIGALVLYDADTPSGGPRNVTSPRQLQELVAAVKATGPIPPLVAVDAEGGFFQKLSTQHGFPATSPASEMGDRNDLDYTRGHAAVIARMLAEAGIDINLAPVVDLHNHANWSSSYLRRTISADAAIVVAHAREFILTHHRHGILGTLKHFPGLQGVQRPYSPGVGELIEDWSEIELEPFRVLISEGLADAVLTTRSTYPQLHPHCPACLSKKIVEGMLRTDLGFDGVVMSDLVELQAIWDAFGLAAGSVLAVNAGIDVIFMANVTRLVPYSDDRAEEVIRVLADAVGRGEIEESRIDQACRRVMNLKARSAALHARAAH